MARKKAEVQPKSLVVLPKPKKETKEKRTRTRKPRTAADSAKVNVTLTKVQKRTCTASSASTSTVVTVTPPQSTSTPVKRKPGRKPKVGKTLTPTPKIPQAAENSKSPKSSRNTKVQPKKEKVLPMMVEKISTRPRRLAPETHSTGTPKPIIEELMDTADQNQNEASSNNDGWFRSCNIM